MTTAELADLQQAGVEQTLIPAGPGDMIIFTKKMVHGSVAVASGQGTRFATYATFKFGHS